MAFETAGLAILGMFLIFCYLTCCITWLCRLRLLNQIHCQPDGKHEEYVERLREREGWKRDDAAETIVWAYGGKLSWQKNPRQLYLGQSL